MKRLKIILLVSLLISAMVFANTARVPEPSKKIYRVLEGNSMNIKRKSSLAVDLSYRSQHVEVGEISDVNITVLTELKTGILNVKIKDLDGGLEGLDEENFKFNLMQSDSNGFLINLEVSSATEGIHYINLVFSIEGQGARVLVVPVNIGSISSRVEKGSIASTEKGVNISVSTAEEEIK